MGRIKVNKGPHGYYIDVAGQVPTPSGDPVAESDPEARKKRLLHVGFKDEDVVLPLVNFRPLCFKDANGRMLSAYFDNRNAIMSVQHTGSTVIEELQSFAVDEDSKFWSVVFSKQTR